MRTITTVTLILTVCFAATGSYEARADLGQACKQQNPTVPIYGGGNVLTAEVAATPAARSCGLSHRRHLPQHHGMLFVFTHDVRPVFWMRNTHIPLSIAFVNAEGWVIDIQNMDPDDDHQRYSPPVAVRYALEVNQGWFRTHGIRAGARLEFQLPDGLEPR